MRRLNSRRQMPLKRRTGEPWLGRLHPFVGKKGPHGIWADQAPAGTGTDDVRYNYLFMELAVELGRMPVAREVARRLLDVYERPKDFFPGSAELAREQFELWEGVSRGWSGGGIAALSRGAALGARHAEHRA